MPNTSIALASLELSALPSGITLVERLLLGLLRKCRHDTVKAVIQPSLDMMQPSLPNNIRPVFDLYTGSLSEADFLERCGAEEFANAVRAGIDFKSLMTKLSATGLTRPDLWWLLTALPLTPQRLSEFLAMSGPERAIAGLCTAEEWQQIQQDIALVSDVIACRRERPLHYLYQCTH
jgi:hypothetical protein